MSRQMKDSGIPWIGCIPKEWNYQRFKYAGTFQKGKLPKSSNIDGLGLPIIGASEMLGKEPRQFSEDKEITTCDYTDILILWDGANAGITASKLSGIVSSTVSRYSCFDSKFYNTYISYLFKSAEPYFRDKVFGTTIPHMNSDYIDDYPMLQPSLSEQKIIADFLNKKCSVIDNLISLQEKMISELKAYKQSVITEAVTKGLNPNVQMKDSGVKWIGEIPEHWKILPFKCIYKLGKGLTITKADLTNVGIPVISYGQVHSKLNNGTSVKDELIRYVPNSFLSNNPDSLVHKGDVIFADTSEDLDGCGNCVYIDKDTLIFAGYHTIIAKNITTIHNNFYSYLFKTDCWRLQIRSMVNGVKLYSIPQRLLSTTSIIVPNENEQISISLYLDKKCSEIDSVISLKQSKIEQLKEYKKSLIYEYVTGKKTVEA